MISKHFYGFPHNSIIALGYCYEGLILVDIRGVGVVSAVGYFPTMEGNKDWGMREVTNEIV